jgi:hypothetical protein
MRFGDAPVVRAAVGAAGSAAATPVLTPGAGRSTIEMVGEPARAESAGAQTAPCGWGMPSVQLWVAAATVVEPVGTGCSCEACIAPRTSDAATITRVIARRTAWFTCAV